MANFIPGTLIEAGTIPGNRLKDAAGITSAQLAQRTLQEFVIPMTAWRVWNARQTNLPGTPLTDDLGLVTGTKGTDMPSLRTEDLDSDGATSNYAGVGLWLPPNYEDGETVVLRCLAGMITNAADTSAVLDAEVYLSAEDGSVGSDLCATDATSINTLASTSVTTVDFTITATTLVAGSHLDVRIGTTVNDGSTGAAVIAAIFKVSLLCDTR